MTMSMLSTLQVSFPVDGQTVFLAPDEHEPFSDLKEVVKVCLAADPKQRQDAFIVAQVLHMTAFRAGWLQ